MARVWCLCQIHSETREWFFCRMPLCARQLWCRQVVLPKSWKNVSAWETVMNSWCQIYSWVAEILGNNSVIFCCNIWVFKHIQTYAICLFHQWVKEITYSKEESSSQGLRRLQYSLRSLASLFSNLRTSIIWAWSDWLRYFKILKISLPGVTWTNFLKSQKQSLTKIITLHFKTSCEHSLLWWLLFHFRKAMSHVLLSFLHFLPQPFFFFFQYLHLDYRCDFLHFLKY